MILCCMVSIIAQDVPAVTETPAQPKECMQKTRMIKCQACGHEFEFAFPKMRHEGKCKDKCKEACKAECKEECKAECKAECEEAAEEAAEEVCEEAVEEAEEVAEEAVAPVEKVGGKHHKHCKHEIICPNCGAKVEFHKKHGHRYGHKKHDHKKCENEEK